MAAGVTRKRPHEGAGRPALVSKKRRRQMAAAYNSESDESGDDEKDGQQETQDGADFAPVDLADSDNDSDDIHNAAADDGASDEGSGEEGSSSEEEGGLKRKNKRRTEEDHTGGKEDVNAGKDAADEDAQGEDADSEDDDNDEDDDDDINDDTDDIDSDSDGIPSSSRAKSQSKRNDPSAFATSLSKILSTKLATAKRSDPILARSAAAAESARAVVDSTLETRARRQMREHRRLALEKGRVRDVLIGTVATGKPASRGAQDEEGGEEGGAAVARETERRLRKTAQRGVVKLFNAVRAAQVAAVDAETANRKGGVLGMGKRETKVQEMSRKGFLDLIASGGGKPPKRKGGAEEA